MMKEWVVEQHSPTLKEWEKVKVNNKDDRNPAQTLEEALTELLQLTIEKSIFRKLYPKDELLFASWLYRLRNVKTGVTIIP